MSFPLPTLPHLNLLFAGSLSAASTERAKNRGRKSIASSLHSPADLHNSGMDACTISCFPFPMHIYCLETTYSPWCWLQWEAENVIRRITRLGTLVTHCCLGGEKKSDSVLDISWFWEYFWLPQSSCFQGRSWGSAKELRKAFSIPGNHEKIIVCSFYGNNILVLIFNVLLYRLLFVLFN